MDVEWAINELNEFLALAELHYTPGGIASYANNRGRPEQIRASAQVAEQVIDRVIPNWRTTIPDEDNQHINDWCQHIEAATRAKAQLLRQEEIADKLGDNAPQLSAGHLHPWIWESARPLWSSGHYREAVSTAARAVNAHTQTRLGRRNLSEHKLIRNAFSPDPPKPGEPRLRLMDDDGSDTFGSIHRGIGAYAEGLYSAIRNPNNHEMLDELPEDEALEQLAAFSVLARWVDTAKLTTA